MVPWLADRCDAAIKKIGSVSINPQHGEVKKYRDNAKSEDPSKRVRPIDKVEEWKQSHGAKNQPDAHLDYLINSEFQVHI